MSSRMMAFVGFLVVDIALLGVRFVEIETNHAPSAELTLAFGAAITATLAMLAAVAKENGGKT